MTSTLVRPRLTRGGLGPPPLPDLSARPLLPSHGVVAGKRPLERHETFEGPPSIAPPPKALRKTEKRVEAKLTKAVNRASSGMTLMTGRDDVGIALPGAPTARELLGDLPAPGTADLRARLRRAAQQATGSKRARQALAKRAKARLRQQRHTWRLRATAGEGSILESLSVSSTTSADYPRRLSFFWAFLERFGLPCTTDRQLDNAATDWADLEFLSGEGCEHGEKLLAALVKWALVARETSVVMLPRFRHSLKSWRKNSPKQSRLPMPEEFLWISAGTLGAAGLVAESLYLVTLFATYLRPTALLTLYCDDLVAPREGTEGVHVLIVAPFERQRSTKQGYYDETVLLDGDVCDELGPLLQEHCEKMVRAFRDEHGGDAPVPMWPFKARAFFEHWRGTVELNGLTAMETVYQARHGGASRDLLLRRRSQTEVKERLQHSSDASFRIYSKPGRVLKLVNAHGPDALRYAGQVRENFGKFIRDGVFPSPPHKQLAANVF